MRHSYKLVSIRTVRGASFVTVASWFVGLCLTIAIGCADNSRARPMLSSPGGAISPAGGTGDAPAPQPSASSVAPTGPTGATSAASSVGPGSGIGPAANLVLVSGNNQSGTSGWALPAPLLVEVEDAGGRPVSGVTVTFAITAGSGRLSAKSAVSDVLGQAASTLTLSALEGTNSVTAKAGGVASPVTFTATGRLAPAQHSDLYVAAGATGASDANDGQSSTFVSGTHGPWLTMSKAATVAQAGDVVHVYAGTYPEDVSPAKDGTATALVRFYAAMGDRPVVRSIQLRGRQFIEIEGFTVVGPKTLPASWVDMPSVVIDDTTVGPIDPTMSWTGGRQALVNRKYATYTSIYDAFNGPSYSLFTAGILVSASSHVTVGNNTVSLHTIGIDCAYGSSHVTISDNEVFHCRNGVWSYTDTGTSFSDSVIDNNHAHHNFGSGISSGASALRITISNNLSEYNAIHQFDVNAACANCTVSHNVGQYGGYYSETMELPGSSAFNFYDVGPANVADGNWASYQYDPTQYDGNGFINDTSASPVTFVNNVAYRNAGSAITFTLCSGNTAVNNTLVENGYKTSSAINGAGIRLSTSTGNTIANNIFSRNRVCGIHSAGTLSSQTVDFNLYAPGAPAIHDSYTTGRVFTTAADVLSGTGQEAHGLTADPGFLDPAAPDLHLAASSPAIAAGDPSRAPLVDNAGLTRHATPDIGAFEHQ